MGPTPTDPLWFRAMVEFRWTVRDIKREFDVPRAIAQSIQHTWPTFSECWQIADESSLLRQQVGH